MVKPQTESIFTKQEIDRIYGSICEKLKSHPAVKDVYIWAEGNIVYIRVVTPSDDRETQYSIYEKEREVWDKHPNTLFDFRLVSLKDFSEDYIIKNIIPEGAVSCSFDVPSPFTSLRVKA